MVPKGYRQPGANFGIINPFHRVLKQHNKTVYHESISVRLLLLLELVHTVVQK